MGSFSGIIQRPLVAASAVIAASVSADVSERFSSLRSLVRGSESPASVSGSVQEERSLWVSQISDSKLSDLSFVSRIRVPVPSVDLLAPNPSCSLAPSVTSLSALRSFIILQNWLRHPNQLHLQSGPCLWLLMFLIDGICLRLVQSICLVPRVVRLRRIEPCGFAWMAWIEAEAFEEIC